MIFFASLEAAVAIVLVSHAAVLSAAGGQVAGGQVPQAQRPVPLAVRVEPPGAGEAAGGVRVTNTGQLPIVVYGLRLKGRDGRFYPGPQPHVLPNGTSLVPADNDIVSDLETDLQPGASHLHADEATPPGAEFAPLYAVFPDGTVAGSEADAAAGMYELRELRDACRLVRDAFISAGHPLDRESMRRVLSGIGPAMDAARDAERGAPIGIYMDVFFPLLQVVEELRPSLTFFNAALASVQQRVDACLRHTGPLTFLDTVAPPPAAR